MDHVEVVEEPLSVEKATQSVTSPSSGAVSLFIGKYDFFK